MAAARRLLILALDAANPDLLYSWAADGTLPNIRELLRTGLSGTSRTVEGLYEGATWPSFYTGLNPAGHGFYWIEQLKTGTYRSQSVHAAQFANRVPFWARLSAAGHRVIVLDVPIAPASRGLNGLQVVEWGCHDAFFGFQTSPRTLGRELELSVGRHPAPQPCDASYRSIADFQQFADCLIRGATAKGELTRRLLREQPWDLAIQVFSETHCGGHQLWHLHDPRHPAFDLAVTDTCGDLVRAVYQGIDSAIGRILTEVGADTTVVLLDLHGMAVPFGANVLLPEFLAKLGVTAWISSRPNQSAANPASERSRHGKLQSWYWQLPPGLRGPLYAFRQRLNQRIRHGSPLDLDPRSKCFNIQVGSPFAGIRLNLAGREPQGVLRQGDEAETFLDRLTQEFLELRQSETGRPLVRRVLRTATLYSGDRLEDLPDLLIEWDPDHRVGSAVVGNRKGSVLRAHSPSVGSLEAVNSSPRTGEHRPEGMFIARGPGIRAGQLDRVVSTLDFAPTFCRMFGVELPHSDGSSIRELLRD